MTTHEEFVALLEKHYRSNFELLAKKYTVYLRSKEKAEDSIQEAYTRALTHWRTCDTTTFHNWYMTILHNCIRDAKRTEIMSGMGDNIEEFDIPVQASAIPLIIYKQIRNKIDNKEPNVRKILNMFLVHQYRPKEIAQVVKENANAIRQIVHRFREEIRKDYQVTL